MRTRRNRDATIDKALTALAEAVEEADDLRPWTTAALTSFSTSAPTSSLVAVGPIWRQPIGSASTARLCRRPSRCPRRGDSPAELAGRVWITSGQASATATDATVRRLVGEPLSGQLLEYVRTGYHAPHDLADFVLMEVDTSICEPQRPNRSATNLRSSGCIKEICP